MAIEASAGAIVFKKNSQIEYLLLYRRANPPFKESWDFSRGNMEKDESEIQTVTREIKEETGIRYLRFIKGFRESIEFFYRREGRLIRKTIVYYLAETNSKEVRLSEEHDDYAWLPIDEALARLRHKSGKEILEKAHRILIK
jgi:8-oxo-dGTP pyrophosphatase MutT (NUDIX family)